MQALHIAISAQCTMNTYALPLMDRQTASII